LKQQLKGAFKMERENTGIDDKKRFLHENGVTWFDKKTERRIFFILTMLMLAWGIVTKIGF